MATVAECAQFDTNLAIRRQVMIYPSLDYTMNTLSMEQNAVGYLLQKSKVAWYFEQYFQHAENRKLASPLYGEFTAHLPETLIITAEFCPLRDESIAYLDKVRKQGVRTEHLHLQDMIHTFMNMEDLVPDTCTQVYQTISDFLNS